MCPWVGSIAVVVEVVIVAFSRSIFTWTVVPERVAPSCGSTMLIVAGDEGRGPNDSGMERAGLGLDEAPGELHAAMRTSAASTAASTAATGATVGQRRRF